MEMTLKKRSLLFSFLLLFLTAFFGCCLGLAALRRPMDALQAALSALALALVCTVPVALALERYLLQPVRELLRGSASICAGEPDAAVDELRGSEFRELAGHLNRLSRLVRQRELELLQQSRLVAESEAELSLARTGLQDLNSELERCRELYRSLMEDAGDAILVVDADQSIRMVNKMAEELIGRPAGELLGLPLTEVLLCLQVGNIPKLVRMFREAAAGARVAQAMPLLRKGGEAMVALLQAICIKSGSENLVQAVFRDVTREREVIVNLEQSAADLARLNRMKDSFLGLASHELKTPLTVIMGYAEMICTDLADRVDKTVLEMVRNIAHAAGRLDNIVQDMVDVSRLDERRLQLKMEEIQLNRLVEASVEELRFFLSQRKQELVLNLDESIPAIMGDTLRLMQLLSNVLGNAIKFTPDGGRISIATSAKYLLGGLPGADAADAGNEHHLFLEIAVADTGIGIDQDDQLRIFDKFFEVGSIQEHSSGKVAFKAKGAGLGLAIAKGIVDMHGGEIWVESPGCDPERLPGSTFRILLPLAPGLGERAAGYGRLLS